MYEKPLVIIIILNWNGKKLLKACLSSLYKLTDYPNYKVLVVDNGSIDGSVDFVKKYYPETDILPLDKNYGFAKGNNLGIKYAMKKYKPKYILLLNNDTKIIQRDWLTKMVEIAESDPKVGVVSCKLLFPDGRIQHAGIILLPKPHHRGVYCSTSEFSQIEEVEAVTGACLLLHKKTVRKVGLLDEIYSPFGFEDVDYCIRTKKFGFKILYHGVASLVHLEGHSTKKTERFGSVFYYYKELVNFNV